MKIFFLFTFLFIFFSISADVFSLWPFGKGSSTEKKSDVGQVLQPKNFWREDVLVNGVRHELNISLVDTPIAVAVTALRRVFPDASFVANDNSILMEQKLESGMRRRLFLLEIDGVSSLLQFTMDLPKNMTELKNSDWPGEFPLPPGARDLSMMYFPERKATFGAFSSPYPKEQVLGQLSSSLITSKWNPVSAESDNLYSGSGEVFLRESPLSIMMIGITETQSGGSHATLYMRPLK